MRPYIDTEQRITPLILLGAILLGIYGSDLHKLMLSVVSFALGQPLTLTIHGRLADIIMVILLVISVLLILISQPRLLLSLFNIPTLLMILMSILVTYTFYNYYEISSVEWYYRFMSGNLLLFFSATIICRTTKTIIFVLYIWIITSLIMSLSVIYLTSIGVTWSSGRADIIQGVGIRTGYYSALSLIFLVSYILFRAKGAYYLFLIIPMMLFLAVGCLASGVKASIVLMVLGVMAVFFITSLRFRKIYLRNSFIIMGLVVISFIIFTSVLSTLSETGLDTGFLSQSTELSAYLEAFQSRLNLALDYITYGSQHFMLGGGIASAYDLDLRTHSALTSFFVQFGIVGVLIYAIWLLSLLMAASIEIASPNFTSLPKKYSVLMILCLVSVFFLAVKAEVTSDLPGNRELWLFSGILLSLINMYSPPYSKFFLYSENTAI